MNALLTQVQVKGLAALNQRVQDLLKDGYHIIVQFHDEQLCLVKLRHHNGNRIVLKLDYRSGYLSQLTNSVRCYNHKVC